MPFFIDKYLNFFFSRSAWSLALIASWRKDLGDCEKINFWVPDYFCNQSLAGVRESGVNLIFYPIAQDMAPNWEACKELSSEKKPHIFLLPHYFGKKNDIAGAISFCNKNKVIFIEDCAHVILPTADIGRSGDFIIYSQHKTLGLSDGALLLANPNMMKKLGKSPNDFQQSFEKFISTLPQKEFSPYAWIVKYWLKKLIPNSLLIKRRQSGNKALDVSDKVGWSYPLLMSSLSKKLIEKKLPRLESYAWLRKKNAAIWDSLFQQEEKTPVFLEENLEFPYMLGVNLAVEKIHELNKLGVVTSAWPDLSLEVLSDPIKHSVAIDLQKNTTFLPVHQNVNLHKYLKKWMKDSSKTVKPMDALSIEWDLPEKEWDPLFSKIAKTHLQQSSAYTQAFCLNKKWKSKFGVVKFEANVLALFSVLERHGPMGIVVARLNRGPIWVQEDVPENIKREVFLLISRYYSSRKGRFLYMAPNVCMDTKNMLALETQGFRRRMLRPWTSLWIDLRQDEQALRASLKGKWRNQLACAERAQLTLSIDESDSSFEWLMKEYVSLMKEKDFEGPVVGFVRNLRAVMNSKDHHFLMLRAFKEDHCIAGVAIVQHGSTATYFIGCNLEEGRRLNANNFLLWNAVVFLKNKGCSWFDLGGINEYATPGITAFKRGMGGVEYRLVGEYRNWGKR